MKPIYTCINKEFLLSENAQINIQDLGLQRGYGIFDFFKILNGTPVFLENHLERFYNSAKIMRLPLDLGPGELKQLLFRFIELNDLPESGVRITLTGGYSTDGYSIATPNLIITQQALNLKASLNAQPVKLISYPHQRQLPEVKSTDYLMAVWLRTMVQEKKADEVLYHQHGIISECPRANIFMVSKDRLITPGSNILKGVIRKKVLDLAEGQFNIEERAISIEELLTAEEVFITSTTKNILPISHIDGVQINNGKAGKISLLIREQLEGFMPE